MPVPLSAFTHIRTHDRSRSRSTIRGSFRRSPSPSTWRPTPRWATAIDAIDKACSKTCTCRPAVQADFQGTAASFQNSLSNEALLILAALVTVYIVLGVLYESFIHPITILSTLPSAGVGALLALILFRQDLSVVAIIGIILLIGIVKKNGIMMVDFALEGGARARQELDRRDLRSQPAALPPHHDDHHGRAAGRHSAGFRHGHWLGTAPAAGHRDGRRTAAEPGSDALHHAGHLHLLRQPGAAILAQVEATRTPDGPSRKPAGAVMNLSAPFIQRPVATTLLTIAIAIAGAIAFTVLPVSPLPQVDFPTISVSARACRAPARRSWRPRSPLRWSGSSATSRASRR